MDKFKKGQKVWVYELETVSKVVYLGKANFGSHCHIGDVGSAGQRSIATHQVFECEESACDYAYDTLQEEILEAIEKANRKSKKTRKVLLRLREIRKVKIANTKN